MMGADAFVFSRNLKERLERALGARIRFSRGFPFLLACRRFLTVRMDLHNRCNLRCTMCFFSLDAVWRMPKLEMSEALVEKIVREVWPMTREFWLSCATEPLINRRIDLLLPRAKAAGVPNVRMITNALALDEERARVILEGGLDGLDVSVDGATAGTYEAIRRGSNFGKVMGNLKRLRDMKRERGSAKPAVCVVAVMMAENLEEWAGLVHLAADIGAEAIHFNPIIEYAEMPLEQRLSNFPEKVNRALELARKAAEERRIRIAAPEPFSLKPGDAPTPSPARRCFVPWDQVMIYPTGEVIPCPDMFAKRRFGNLEESSFRDIYYGKAFRDLRNELRSGNLGTICRHCAGLERKTLNDPAIFHARSISSSGE